MAINYWNKTRALLDEIRGVRRRTPVTLSYNEGAPAPLVVRVLFFSIKMATRFHVRFWLRSPPTQAESSDLNSLFSKHTQWDVEQVYGNISISSLTARVTSSIGSHSVGSPDAEHKLLSIYDAIHSWVDRPCT
ncbi:hypothetical protein EV182_006799 [Spiromyces aspiralis]|uniref:Uncharacterized protein n=1 Tax=Spiromyces aspiralis TaxID=68401 RepID=A0ACC1H8A9_9FUNG|nr:hypothetical protein EV182_006799 [Spiromyces aspiralis]